MRRLRKAVLLVLLIVVVLACASAWLLFYSHDLPDTAHLVNFAPKAETSVVDACLAGPVIAVPLDQISPHLRDVIAITESSPDGETALTSLLKSWFRDSSARPRSSPSLQVARTLFCTSSRRRTRQIREIRLAIQLDGRFSRRDLFAIYLNRLYFGECGTGVENAAQCYFHKHAAYLSLAESAMLAGIVRSPGRLSPFRHADRALQERNAVLDEMVAAGKLTLAEAQSAKSAPLLD